MILILKSTQNQGVTIECKRDLVGDQGVIDHRGLATSEISLLIGEEKDDRSGEGALGTPLRVALLLV